MKKILLLGTGGTIACKRTPDGLKPVITSEEILTYVPDSRNYCQIDSIQILNIDSTNIQPSHWLAVAKAIEEHYDEYDGFVITHGTDTMAYTAAALSYLIQNSPKPIVITGAQKPIDMENTDARTNLADSLRFSSHDNNLAHGFVPEHFLILRNGHQKLPFVSDGPVFIYCRNQFHLIFLFLCQDQFLCVRQTLNPVTEGVPLIQLVVLSCEINIDQSFII